MSRFRVPLRILLLLLVAGGGYLVWRQLQPVPLPAGFASGNGRTEGTEIDIAAKIPGRIRAIMANEGDFVTEGQVLAQMGFLAHQTGDEDRALALLEGASVRAPDARLLLACIVWKRGDQKRALEILQFAAAVNKKHALLHNTYAWMLHKIERADDAQAVLANFLKKDATSAPTKDNLLRLQNRTRMTMQGFDMQWYALGLERPPQAMGQMRRAPKGFREPPKRRGG